MSALLDALGRLAREEQSAWSGLPAESIPLLSARDKDDIAGRISTMQAAERAHRATESERAASGVGLDRPGTKLSTKLSTNLSTPPFAKRKPAWSGRWPIAVSAVVAAAAALILVVESPSPSSDREPLPGYAVSASGGLKTLRGTTSSPADTDESAVAALQVLAADTELRILCRPRTAFGGPVSARAFFVRDGGQASEFQPALRTAPTGAIELTARGRDIFGGAPARGQVHVVVGRPESLRAIGNPGAALGATSTAEAQWLTVPVDAR